MLGKFSHWRQKPTVVLTCWLRPSPRAPIYLGAPCSRQFPTLWTLLLDVEAPSWRERHFRGTEPFHENFWLWRTGIAFQKQRNQPDFAGKVHKWEFASHSYALHRIPLLLCKVKKKKNLSSVLTISKVGGHLLWFPRQSPEIICFLVKAVSQTSVYSWKHFCLRT